MKERFRNIITTALGTLIMLSGVIILTLSGLALIPEVSIFTIIIIELLGWLFVAAKDSLLEGITFNLLKINKQ
ncbi:MAG: hypothetical protein WC942_09490 [Clostridia bacterium]|jgi:hypothetical protein